MYCGVQSFGGDSLFVVVVVLSKLTFSASNSIYCYIMITIICGTWAEPRASDPHICSTTELHLQVE